VFVVLGILYFYGVDYLFSNCFNMKYHLLSGFLVGLFFAGFSFPSFSTSLQVNDITSSNPTFMCIGGDATTLSVGNYSTYLWSTGETTPTIRVASPGYFTVTVTDASGCSGVSNKFRLTGRGGGGLPSTIDEIYGNTTLCEGESVTLIGGRDASLRYLWSTGDTVSFITISESASIFLVEIDENGCELGFSPGVNIDVFDADQPSISVSGPLVFCNDNDVTSLTATYDTNYDFRWSNGERSSTITLNTPGTYYGISSNSAGCEVISNSVTIQAVNQSIPQVYSNGDLILCVGEELTLATNSPSPGYQWSNGETSQEITVSDGGTYSLSLVDDSGCNSVPATIEVQKPTLMTPEITYSGSLVFCDGSSLKLSANINPFYIWQWQNGSHSFDTLVTQTGTFFITGIDQLSGCLVKSDTVTVSVGEIQKPTIQIIGSPVLCEGDSVTLESSPSAEYYWLGPGTDVVDNISRQFVVYDGGTYDLAVVNDFGCVASADPIEIFLDTLANEPQIHGHRNFEINVFKTYYTITEPETQVNWTIRGGSLDFANRDTISVFWTSLTDLELCVEYTSPKGCVVKKTCIDDMMIPVEDTKVSSIALFPNPAEDFVKIETPYFNKIKSLEVYDQAGKLIKKTVDLDDPWVDVSSLHTGMYYVVFDFDEVQYHKKLYKQ